MSEMQLVFILAGAFYNSCMSSVLVYGLAAFVVLYSAMIWSVVCHFLGALWMHLYRYWRNVKDPYDHCAWNVARKWYSKATSIFSRVYNGDEIIGFEKIPDKGAAVIVFYHGPLPIDLLFLVCKIFLEKKRLVRSVFHKYTVNLPFLSILFKIMGCSQGRFEDCLMNLLEGNLVCIGPGGEREGYFSQDYRLLWEKRIGFARLAQQAKVPIIPVFTRNIQQFSFVPRIIQSFLQPIYEKHRGMIAPCVGVFPVKLKTFIGDPIPYDACATPEELAEKCANAMEKLISDHQEIPGSLVTALLERIDWRRKTKSA